MANAGRLNAFGITVDDMGESLAFYRLVGLNVPLDANGESLHVDIELAGGVRLMLDAASVTTSMHPDWVAPTDAGRVALAFECDSAAEVDATHAAIVAAGHQSRLAPFDAPWGQRYATVVDPNGLSVDLYAALETGS